MKTTLVPPYEEWSTLLRRNLESVTALHKIIGDETVRVVRGQVIEAARSYATKLQEVARLVDVSLEFGRLMREPSSRPVVMAGHQPVIYHPGLLEKTIRLSSIAREAGAIAINVTIDTDEGDGGRIIWPLIKGDDVVIKQGSISVGEGVYRDQRVAKSEDVAALFSEITRDLQDSGCGESAQRVGRVSAIYQALTGQPIALAHAIVRMSERGAGYLELPLSQLIELPAMREVMLRHLDDAKRCTSLYNSTLETYRREHKIKNPANPFPNLSVEAEVVEMPFWTIGNGARTALTIDSRKDRSSFASLTIAPRGGMVTLLLRGLCSDLFIHGLGGGKYDPFVDAFSVAYWGEPLPRFVIASATQYLFPEQVARYSYAREVKSRFKDMVSHTDNFYRQGLFSESEEKALAPLVEQRRTLVEAFKNVAAPKERSSIAHSLNEVNRLIKVEIEGGAVGPLLVEGSIDDARFNRWACREYPFFYLP